MLLQLALLNKITLFIGNQTPKMILQFVNISHWASGICWYSAMIHLLTWILQPISWSESWCFIKFASEEWSCLSSNSLQSSSCSCLSGVCLSRMRASGVAIWSSRCLHWFSTYSKKVYHRQTNKPIYMYYFVDWKTVLKLRFTVAWRAYTTLNPYIHIQWTEGIVCRIWTARWPLGPPLHQLKLFFSD